MHYRAILTTAEVEIAILEFMQNHSSEDFSEAKVKLHVVKEMPLTVTAEVIGKEMPLTVTAEVIGKEQEV